MGWRDGMVGWKNDYTVVANSSGTTVLMVTK